MNDTYESG